MCIRDRLEAALAGTFGKLLHAAVVDVAAAVEYDLGDTLFHSPLSNHLSNLAGGFLVAAVAFEILLDGGGGNQGHALLVVNQLGVDIAKGAEYIQAGPSGGAVYKRQPYSLSEANDSC